MTAEHVLSANKNIPLSYFGADGWSRSFGGDFEISPEHDLAVRLIREDEIEAMGHVLFLEEATLGRVAPIGERFYASVAGYPETAAVLKDKMTLDTRMEVYSDFANERPDGLLLVKFDKKAGAVGEIGHTQPKDPFGMSGSAIFGLLVDGRQVRPRQNALLVGISTRWKRHMKCIQGSSVAALIPLLDRLLAGSGRERAVADQNADATSYDCDEKLFSLAK